MLKRKTLSIFTIALMIISLLMPYDIGYYNKAQAKGDCGDGGHEEGEDCGGEDHEEGGGCGDEGSGGSKAQKTIKGVIIGKNNQPLNDITVRLFKEGSEKHSTTTNSNGEYSFSIKGNGKMDLIVDDVPGYLPNQKRSFSVKGSDPSDVLVNLTLTPDPNSGNDNPGGDDDQTPGGDGDEHNSVPGGYVIHGTITGKDNVPIEGAVVWFYKDGTAKHNVLTNATGDYSFTIKGIGAIEIKVDNVEGYLPVQSASFQSDGSLPEIEVNFTLTVNPETDSGNNDGENDDDGCDEGEDGEHGESFNISGTVTLNGNPVNSSMSYKVVLSRGMGGEEDSQPSGEDSSCGEDETEGQEDHTSSEVYVGDGGSFCFTTLEGAGWYNVSLIRYGHMIAEKRVQLKGHSSATVSFEILDEIAPTATIEYSTTEPTNTAVTAKLIPSETVIITNNDGNDIYTFHENGSFIFEFEDLAGNTGSVEATVNNISNDNDGDDDNGNDDGDNNSGNDGGNQEDFRIRGTLTFNSIPVSTSDNVKVLLIRDSAQQGSPQALTGNSINSFGLIETMGSEHEDEVLEVDVVDGTYEFTLRSAGWYTIKVMKDLKVIMEKRLHFQGHCDLTEDFNFDVPIVSVNPTERYHNTSIDVQLTVMNVPDAKIYYNFDVSDAWLEYIGPIAITQEGISTLRYYAKSPASTIESEVGQIVYEMDKIAPTAIIQYSTTAPTYNNVTARLIPSESVTIINNNGLDVYVFDANGNFTFEFADMAGNLGTATASVGNIVSSDPGDSGSDPDTNPGTDPGTGPGTGENVDPKDITNNEVPIVNANPKGGIFNKNQIITLFVDNVALTSIYYSFDGEEWFEYNGSITISKEGTSSIKYYAVNLSNNIKSEVEEQIYEIDTIAPFAEIQYSIANPTNKNVTATLVASESITVVNNGGKLNYTFKENGKFVFDLMDKAGNLGSAIASVDYIDKIAPNVSLTETAGSYEGTKKIVFELSEDGIVYYTTDGSIPTVSSNKYTEPIILDETTSFRFFALDLVGNASETHNKLIEIKALHMIAMPKTGDKVWIPYLLVVIILTMGTAIILEIKSSKRV